MISERFTSWIIDLDKRFQCQNRNVALIIDNCPAHPDVQSQLKAIRLVFLPPNTTYVLQPCDQGIIKNLKIHYRKYCKATIFSELLNLAKLAMTHETLNLLALNVRSKVTHVQQ